MAGKDVCGSTSYRGRSDKTWAGRNRQNAQVLGGLVRATCPRRGKPGSGAARSCPAFLLSQVREHARTRTRPTAPPIHKYTQTHRHFPASPARGGLACLRGESGLAPRPLSGCSRADRRRLSPGVGGGVVPRRRRRRALLLPPPHAVPRPGRLCPMRSGVAGRWGVFLFWVEVEAEEREELATSNRRCRPRRGRWRRPSRNREVSPPPPTAAARRFPASSRSRNSRACPGPLVFALRSPAAPGPGRTRRPHEEGRERSDQEQV